MKPAVLVNGEAVDRISVNDRGLQYGDGLFETIAVRHTEPLLWERHMQRLTEGCGRLGIPAPDRDLLRTEVKTVCISSDREVLKIIITRGSSTRGYRPETNTAPTRIVSVSPWPNLPRDYALSGVDVLLCRTRVARTPALAGLKHLNRLDSVLARAEWRDEYAEGLMQDEQDAVIEGTRTNVFIASNDGLLTPDLSACGVAGVMRSLVMERADELGIPCRTGTLSLERLMAANEAFLCNSLIGIWPIKTIARKKFRIGETTRKLQESIADSHCFDKPD